MNQTDRKALALAFLQHLRSGRRAEAERMLAAQARHHNPYFAAGMPALLAAVEAAAQGAPDRSSEIKHVVADGDFVMVHSHIRHRPGDLGASVVHLLRFEGDKVAELWDIGQPVPAENANADGMF